MIAELKSYIFGGGPGGSRSVKIEISLDPEEHKLTYHVSAGGWKDPYGPERKFGMGFVRTSSMQSGITQAIRKALENESKEVL